MRYVMNGLQRGVATMVRSNRSVREVHLWRLGYVGTLRSSMLGGSRLGPG